MKLHLIIRFLSLSLSAVSGQISQTCKDATEAVYTNPDFIAPYGLVMATFLEQPLPTDPVIARTVYKWDSQKSNAVYSRMKTNCEREDGHVLCDVTTKVRFQQEFNGQEGENRITEKNKPVCFPPACADSEVSIIEATPARCNPATLPCEIGNYDVKCPASRNVTATGTCTQTFNTVTRHIFIQRTILESAVIASCGGAVAGVANNLCSVQIGDVTVETIKDFTGWETDDSYQVLGDFCEASGGRMCHVDMKTNAIRDQGNVGTADVRRTYKQYPLCAPAQCNDENIPFLIENRVANFISGGVCNLDDGTCSVEVQNIDCDTKSTSEPSISSAPSKAEGSNTGSPDRSEPTEPAKTEAPTKAPTKAPPKDATSSGTSLLAEKMTTFVSFACVAMVILSQN